MLHLTVILKELLYPLSPQLWSARNFSLIKTLAGHEGKVMCIDASPDGSHLLASVSYDRTIKLWAPESAETGNLLTKNGSYMEQ